MGQDGENFVLKATMRIHKVTDEEVAIQIIKTQGDQKIFHEHSKSWLDKFRDLKALDEL